MAGLRRLVHLVGVYAWLYMRRHTRLTCRRVRLVGVYEWLGFADFYTFPHIVYWDSVEELVDLAAEVGVDFRQVSDFFS